MLHDHCSIIHTILHSLLNLVAPCSGTFVQQCNIRMPEKTVKYGSNGYESVLKNRLLLNIARRTDSCWTELYMIIKLHKWTFIIIRATLNSAKIAIHVIFLSNYWLANTALYLCSHSGLLFWQHNKHNQFWGLIKTCQLAGIVFGIAISQYFNQVANEKIQRIQKKVHKNIKQLYL